MYYHRIQDKFYKASCNRPYLYRKTSKGKQEYHGCHSIGFWYLKQTLCIYAQYNKEVEYNLKIHQLIVLNIDNIG